MRQRRRGTTWSHVSAAGHHCRAPSEAPTTFSPCAAAFVGASGTFCSPRSAGMPAALRPGGRPTPQGLRNAAWTSDDRQQPLTLADMLDAAEEHGRASGPSLIEDYGFLSGCTSAALVDREAPSTGGACLGQVGGSTARASVVLDRRPRPSHRCRTALRTCQACSLGRTEWRGAPGPCRYGARACLGPIRGRRGADAPK